MVHLEDEGVVLLLLPGRGAHHCREALGDLETWTKCPSDLRCTKRGVCQPGWGLHDASPEPSPNHSIGDKAAEHSKRHTVSPGAAGSSTGRQEAARALQKAALLPVLAQQLVIPVRQAPVSSAVAPPVRGLWDRQEVRPVGLGRARFLQHQSLHRGFPTHEPQAPCSHFRRELCSNFQGRI